MMILSNEKRGQLLWILILLSSILGLPVVILPIFNITGCRILDFVSGILFFLLPFIIFLHAIWKMGVARGIFLLTLPALTGFIFEFFGLRYGRLLGGGYEYTADYLTNLTIFSVPVYVLIYWSILVYLGYSITTSILEYCGISKPFFPNKQYFAFLFLLLFLDGLIVTAIDIFMDPIQVFMGTWTWLDPGPYFNIPTGNFLGWFLVAFISLGIFRLFEYFKPANFDRVSYFAEFIPTIAYADIMLVFFMYAYRYNLRNLMVVGVCAMLPFILISSVIFIGSVIYPRSYSYDR